MATIDLPFVESVEAELSRLLADLDRLDSGFGERGESLAADSQSRLEGLNQRLDQWRATLDGISADVSESQRQLEASQAELLQWHEAFAEARQRAQTLARAA